jgi:hypothetical protein
LYLKTFQSPTSISNLVWSKSCARYRIWMLTELLVLNIFSVCVCVAQYTKHNVNLKQYTVYCRFRCCFSVHFRMLFQVQKSCTVNHVERSNVLRYLVFDIYINLYHSTNRKNTVSVQSHFFSSHITKKAYDALNWDILWKIMEQSKIPNTIT